MTWEFLSERYESVAAEYRLPDGTLPSGMQLKYDHTMEVVSLAEQIAGQESFTEQEFFLGKSAALFHDVYRFEQVRRFRSFDDRSSGIDHAHEGVRLLWTKDLLAGLSFQDQTAIAAAVEYHNKMTVAREWLSPYGAKAALVVRDADKISILRILVASLQPGVQADAMLFWDREAGPLSPRIAEAILGGKPVPHELIRSRMDFYAMLLAWTGDLNFAASAEIILKDQSYEKIFPVLPASEETDRIIQTVRERLQCLSSK